MNSAGYWVGLASVVLSLTISIWFCVNLLWRAHSYWPGWSVGLVIFLNLTGALWTISNTVDRRSATIDFASSKTGLNVEEVLKNLQKTFGGSELNLQERTVDLLFASNRKSIAGPDGPDLTGDRDVKLTFGSVRVHIPEDHKIGRIELPQKANWIKLRFRNEEPDRKKHFIIEQIGIFDEMKFVEIAKANPKKTAVLFVHGFNNTFRESALRFSQIVWDLQFDGISVLFSWPSMSGIDNYNYDTFSALGAREHFRNLIGILRDKIGVEDLHIIAHSMGNFVVLEVLKELAPAATPRVSELIMAAPDVDVDLFDGFMKKVALVARGMTLYASKNDWAMVASRKANKKGRAGDVFADGPLIAEKLDSIDVSAIGNEMFGLNHDTFASNRSLVDDIGRLIRKGERPPNDRSPQIRGFPEGRTPPAYWRYAE